MCSRRSDTAAASDAAAALLLLTGSPPSSLDVTECTPPLVTTEQPPKGKHNPTRAKKIPKTTSKNRKPRSPRRRTSRTSQQPVKPELDYSGLTEDEVAEVNTHPALFRSKAIAVIHCRNQPDKYELAENPCDKCFGKWECYVRRPEPVVESPSSCSSEPPSTKKKGRCTRKTFAGTACASCKKGRCSFSRGRGGHNKHTHVEKTPNLNLGLGRAHGPSGGRVTRNISASSSGSSSVNTLASANTVDSAAAVSAIVETELETETNCLGGRVAAASRHSTATAAISAPNRHTHQDVLEPPKSETRCGGQRQVSYKRPRSYSFDEEDEDAYYGPDYRAAKRRHMSATTSTPITSTTHTTKAGRSDTEADVHPRRHMYTPSPPLAYVYHPHDRDVHAYAHTYAYEQDPSQYEYETADESEPQWLGRMDAAEGVEQDHAAYGGDHDAYTGTHMALPAPAVSVCAHECAHCGSAW